jgi:hypothetical protein
MLRVEFESTITVLERAKIVHVLDRAATVIRYCKTIKKLNSMVLVHKRTIPAERPQPAGEVSANLS